MKYVCALSLFFSFSFFSFSEKIQLDSPEKILNVADNIKAGDTVEVNGTEYKIIERIGSGGSSHVYKAEVLEKATHSPSTKNKIVALKIRRAPTDINSSDPTEVESSLNDIHNPNHFFSLERQKEDLEILKSKGINAPEVIDVEKSDKLKGMFLVLEHLEGKTLYDLLKNEGSPEKILSHFAKVESFLEEFRALGFFPGDDQMFLRNIIYKNNPKTGEAELSMFDPGTLEVIPEASEDFPLFNYVWVERSFPEDVRHLALLAQLKSKLSFEAKNNKNPQDKAQLEKILQTPMLNNKSKIHPLWIAAFQSELSAFSKSGGLDKAIFNLTLNADVALTSKLQTEGSSELQYWLQRAETNKAAFLEKVANNEQFNKKNNYQRASLNEAERSLAHFTNYFFSPQKEKLPQREVASTPQDATTIVLATSSSCMQKLTQLSKKSFIVVSK